MRMSLNKGRILKNLLALSLALVLPAGNVCAAGIQEPGVNVEDEAVPGSEAELTDEEVSEPLREVERKTRFIKTEEEVTKICGAVFSFDVKFTERQESEKEEQEQEQRQEPEKEEQEQEQQPESEKEKQAEEQQDEQPENDPEKEAVIDVLMEGEAKEADILKFESADPEVAVIDEDESGRIKIKTVGVGDTLIKITVPETEQYEKTEAQMLLHVTPPEMEASDEAASEQENAEETAAAALGQENAEEIPVAAMSLLPASNLTLLENAAGGISLKWEKVKEAKGYYLERSTTGRAPWSRVKTAANADDVTYIDTQVKEGSAYYYRVRAFEASGKEGFTGASKKIVRIIAPVLSVGLAATGTELKWNRVTGCGGYYVYRRSPSQKDWTTVATLTQPGEITWRDTAAGNGTTYIYSVRAYTGSSLSPYAGAKSYVRVAAPSVKSFKRKSSTKYKITWKKNSFATGYQVQYAQNGMFVGAKKVTVKNAKTTSCTLSKLKKKKNYYARVRAYKKVGGKTYYSGWSAASNVKKTRTATATALSKKKKVFEIRTWAKQKMYQYDILQGSCTDGTYAYYLLHNKSADNCKIVKVKRSNLKVVKVSGVLNVAHGNDMTYDSHRKRLVVVHSTGADPKALTSVNPNTLRVIESQHVQIPKKLAGGSLEDAKAATAFCGIAYSSGRKQYAVTLSHNYNFVVLDSELHPVRYIKVRKKNNYIVQGIDATDDYILLAQSPKTSKQKYNIITVYDWDGNYISKINVKKGYEIESIYHVGSNYYAGFYRSYYKTYYKNVVKDVKVDGKVKKKKAKVKYKKLQRDNYVYQIKGI